MKIIRVILVLLVMVAFIPLSHAQLEKADKLFNLCRYAEAIPVYTKMVEKVQNPNRVAEAISRLADCYRFTNNPEMASHWYANAIQLENVDPISYLYLGQALQSNGMYMGAKAAFLKYSQLKPSDPRGSLLAASCDLPDQWDNLPGEFEILNVSSLNSKWSDFGPVFYKTGIVFTSDRRADYLDNTECSWTGNNYFDMYFASLDNPQNPKVEHSFSKDLNQPYHDGPAAFSHDFNTIYFTRSYNDKTVKKDNIKNHLLKIFYAQTNALNWDSEKPFFLNSEDYSVAHPSLSPDGKTIFFSSDMPGGFGSSDIWFCKWEANKWSAPENPGKALNTFGNEVFPFMLNDSTLYFASNGLPGYGGLDIFVTKKKDGSWQTPRNLRKPVNSSYDDFSFILDATGVRGFFSSNRPDGRGSDDIYAVKRMRDITDPSPVSTPKSMPLLVSGYVKSNNSLTPIAGAMVYLLNTKSGNVKVLRTNAKGFYKSAVDKTGSYLTKAIKLNYLPDCFNFSQFVSGITLVKAPRDLLLEKLEVNQVFKVEIDYTEGSWDLPKDAASELDNIVKIMRQNPISVELGSHTDSHGTFLDNDILSQKRADAAVDYIIQKGISRNRIKAKGYGERKLINHCSDGVPCSAEEDKANRRTEIKITSVSAAMPQEYLKIADYKDGDEFDRGLLPGDFFDSCLDHK